MNNLIKLLASACVVAISFYLGKRSSKNQDKQETTNNQ